MYDRAEHCCISSLSPGEDEAYVWGLVKIRMYHVLFGIYSSSKIAVYELLLLLYNTAVDALQQGFSPAVRLPQAVPKPTPGNTLSQVGKVLGSHIDSKAVRSLIWSCCACRPPESTKDPISADHQLEDVGI